MIEDGPIADSLTLLLIRNLPDPDVRPVVIRKTIHDAKAQIRPHECPARMILRLEKRAFR
jgi:hypothetical protein